MSKRHSDALAIQLGAVNPSGIAHSIVEGCREVRAEGGDVQMDAAIRLMAHQLAFICKVAEIDNTLDVYGKLVDECSKNIHAKPEPKK